MHAVTASRGDGGSPAGDNVPMTEAMEQSNNIEKQSPKQEDAGAATLYKQAAPKRTSGLWLVDAGIYPLVTNFGVFALSVIFTFLTDRGGDMARIVGKNGTPELRPVYGKVGQWFAARGTWLDKQFRTRFNMDEKSAQMSRIVFFSFADGSLLAPLVKLLEDRREKIALWIDEKLGTKPEDLSVYEAEPKQSWGSVLLGRFATAAVVVPVAVALNTKIFHKGMPSDPKAVVFGSKVHPANTSLNDVLFNDPSIRHGEELLAKPTLRSKFTKFIKNLTGLEAEHTIFKPDAAGSTEIKQTSQIHISAPNERFTQTDIATRYSAAPLVDSAAKTLAKMTYFEAFYTTVCTAGLYFSSRFIAKIMGNEKKVQTERHQKILEAQERLTQLKSTPQTPAANDTNYRQDISPKPEAPSAKVHGVMPEAQQRIAAHEPMLATGA